MSDHPWAIKTCQQGLVEPIVTCFPAASSGSVVTCPLCDLPPVCCVLPAHGTWGAKLCKPLCAVESGTTSPMHTSAAGGMDNDWAAILGDRTGTCAREGTLGVVEGAPGDEGSPPPGAPPAPHSSAAGWADEGASERRSPAVPASTAAQDEPGGACAMMQPAAGWLQKEPSFWFALRCTVPRAAVREQ